MLLEQVLQAWGQALHWAVLWFLNECGLQPRVSHWLVLLQRIQSGC
jgi:hypothetical protein